MLDYKWDVGLMLSTPYLFYMGMFMDLSDTSMWTVGYMGVDCYSCTLLCHYYTIKWVIYFIICLV